MTDYAGSWHDEGETPVTSDRTSRLAAFLAKARANAGVPSPAVSPEPRRFLSSTEEPRVPEPVDDNTATSATRPLTILSARVSPGAETADPGGAVPDATQPHATVGSTSETRHETISGGAVPDATQPHATVGSTSETRHETMSRAGRNSTAAATERTTPPPAADHSAQATAVSASDSGIGLANHRTDTTSTGTRPKAQPARPTPKPPTGGGRPVAPPLGEMLVEQKQISRDQLRQAMERQKRTRRRLGRVLVELGFTTQEAVLEALSAQLEVPSTRVNSYTVNADAVHYLSEKVARKHMAFPLLKVGSTLVVDDRQPQRSACPRRPSVRLRMGWGATSAAAPGSWDEKGSSRSWCSPMRYAI